MRVFETELYEDFRLADAPASRRRSVIRSLFGCACLRLHQSVNFTIRRLVFFPFGPVLVGERAAVGCLIEHGKHRCKKVQCQLTHRLKLVRDQRTGTYPAVGSIVRSVSFWPKGDCGGCRGPRDAHWTPNCAFLSCVAGRGHRYCFECDDFVCDALEAFAADGHEHHRLAVENMKRMRDIGLESWIGEQPRAMFCPGWVR